VSNQTSRPSGARLEDPARPARAAVRSRPQSNPSWLKVIGTTLRLWLRRHVLRVPDSERLGARHKGRIAVAAIAVLVIVAGGAVVALTVHSRAGGSSPQRASGRPTSARPKLTPAQAAARAAAAAAAVANDQAAARWIAAQVGQSLVIGCDPATCAAILAAGYPTGRQVVLQSGVSLPGPGSIVVATAAVRAQYGAQLGSAIPAVIASFGSGPQAVQVGVVVPGGPAAYRQDAIAAHAASRAAARKLLANRRVQARGMIRTDLGAGRVDPRLITVLRRLATHYTVDIVHFGDTGPRTGGTVPFRMAEVAVLSSRAGRHVINDLAGLEKLLKSQPAGYRAELIPKRLAGGVRVLEIKFLAPSPL
jgi:hypothetical protein